MYTYKIIHCHHTVSSSQTRTRLYKFPHLLGSITLKIMEVWPNRISTDWLTERPTDWPTNAFSQAKLNNGWSYKLDSLTVQHCFILRCAFWPTIAAPMLCIMVLLKLAFVLLCAHSFLHYHIRDDLQYAYYGFSVTLGECSAKNSASYTIICSKCYQMCSCSWIESRMTMRHTLFHRLKIERTLWQANILASFDFDWINYRDAFHAVFDS